MQRQHKENGGFGPHNTMEDFDINMIPFTPETDVLVLMTINMMINCHQYGLSSDEVWSHLTAFGLAGEA